MTSGRSGQGTLEYGLVLLAFMGMVAALASLVHAGGEGQLVAHSLDHASHSLSQGLVAALQDVLAF